MVLVLGASQDQARMVFDYAKAFLESSPVLAQEIAEITQRDQAGQWHCDLNARQHLSDRARPHGYFRGRHLARRAEPRRMWRPIAPC
jgi:hypothetical protein